MEWWQLIIAILGSSVLVELIRFIADRKKRRDTVSDRRETTDERIDDTENQLEELRAETAEQFGQVNVRLDKQDKKLDGICNNSIARSYNEIRRRALASIRVGHIEAEDLRELIELYEGYKQLPGANGFLEQIMTEVRRLRLIQPNDNK